MKNEKPKEEFFTQEYETSNTLEGFDTEENNEELSECDETTECSVEQLKKMFGEENVKEV